MKSRTTNEFRKLFANLPKQVQEQTRAAYRQFKEDPNYPSLRIRRICSEIRQAQMASAKDAVIKIFTASPSDICAVLETFDESLT